MRQPASPENLSQTRPALSDGRGQAQTGTGVIQPPSSAAVPRGRQGLHPFLKGFTYAWSGITYVVRTQRNMRFHLCSACAVVALATLLHLALLEWAILLTCILGVIVAEMLNTIVEAVVDLITDRYHPLAKIAKDVAAGAVLLSAIGSAGIGLLILGPHLWHALFR